MSYICSVRIRCNSQDITLLIVHEIYLCSLEYSDSKYTIYFWPSLLYSLLCRPQEIDEAARRRLVKRLYIPLPDTPARRQIVTNLMQQQVHNLTDNEFDQIGQQTDGEVYMINSTFLYSNCRLLWS